MQRQKMNRQVRAADTGDDRQQSVDRHFSTSAGWWQSVYDLDDLPGAIYRHRRGVVLETVGRLELAEGAHILDVGCGAGLTAIALASRGFTVEALDTVPDMLSLARANAAAADVSDRVITGMGDIHHLRYPDGTFDCVIAMGVLPWIDSPEIAIREMGRVVKPGGAVIMTADNRWRLSSIIDPRFNPVFASLKRWVARFLDASGVRKGAENGVWVKMHSRREIDR